MQTRLIAEIGVNHNGDVKLAHQMVAAAANSGANIVKFQTHLSSKEMVKDINQRNLLLPDIYNLIEKVSLSKSELRDIKMHVEDLGLQFLSTPFSLEAVDMMEDLGVDMYKVGSGESDDFLLLDKICSTNKKLIVSTGMSDFDEVDDTVSFLNSYGADFVLMQCTSQYPAPYSSINLHVINEYRDRWQCEVGLSDHSLGIVVSLAAVALGARWVEKHFTIDKKIPGTDQSSSIDPSELKELQEGICIIEESSGNEKCCVSQEVKGLFRHSLVAFRDLCAGEEVDISMIVSKRPLDGIPSKFYRQVIGKKLCNDVSYDTSLKWSDVCLEG